jgi:hypothetical protein
VAVTSSELDDLPVAPARRRGGRSNGALRPAISVLEVILGVEHRLLEVDHVRQHLIVIDVLFVGGQDVQVAVVEHPSEQALLEDGVVDLVERAVAALLVEQAFDLDDPAVRDDVFLIAPGQVHDRDPHDADDEQDGAQPGQQLPGHAVCLDDRREEEDDQPHEHDHDRPQGVGYGRQPMLPVSIQSPLVFRHQRVRVAHPRLLHRPSTAGRFRS